MYPPPFIVLFVLGAMAIFVVGGLCGIIALSKVAKLRKQVDWLKWTLIDSPASSGGRERAVQPARMQSGPRPTRPPGAAGPSQPPRRPSPPPGESPVASPRPPAAGAAPAAGSGRASGLSLEMLVGTQWMARAGVVMFLIGLAFLLRFAYDHDLIGEAGRLAIGCLSGAVLLIAGERARRQSYNALFQALMGGGLATFYVCIYFSFAVYNFTAPEIAMTLAVLVTAASVVLAVAYNARSIAILGLIGGYMSPLFLGAGPARPEILLTYVFVLSLTALGVACHRRWRAVGSVAFVGAVGMYWLWYGAHYEPAEMGLALLFTTLFYVLFLAVPAVHGILRQTRLGAEDLVLVGVNSAVWLLSYYVLLYRDHMELLGFMAVAQAVIIFGLFAAYRRGNAADVTGAQSMLVVALILATLAIPLQVRVYGLPIVWAAEAVLLAFLGLRYQNRLCQLAAFPVLFLAIGSLWLNLPLHTAPFTPVFNAPFASWLLVTAAAAAVAWMFHRWGENRGAALFDGLLSGSTDVRPREVAAFIAYCLGCAALSLEAWTYWQFNHAAGPYRAVHQFDTLILLWSIIPLGTAVVLRRLRISRFNACVLGVSVVGVIVFAIGMSQYSGQGRWFTGMPGFWARLAFPAALFLILRLMDAAQDAECRFMEIAAHLAVTVLVTAECLRWTQAAPSIQPEMGVGIVSALWALHGVILIWLGLVGSVKAWRVLGFVLFGMAAGKTLLIDTQMISEVYRVVSYLGIGVLLLLGGYFYQRYSARLAALTAEKREDASPNVTP